MFALVDVTNRSDSCQRVFQPAPVGRPVVVLSNNDGCAIARSNAAKDLGIKMAQPWFQVRHLERQAGLIALSANFELYGDMSSRMMTIVAQYAPRQEIYSIDECFLDFDGVRRDLLAVGRDIRATVLQWTGLPTSVGFAPTKTLAKLANHVAKTADRKPGTYPAELAQVCHFGSMSHRTRSSHGRDGGRRCLGHGPHDQRAPERGRQPHGARPGECRCLDPAQAVQRGAREDRARAARNGLP